MTRKRVYLRSMQKEHRFTVTAPGFAAVELDPVRALPHRETVIDVYLTPE